MILITMGEKSKMRYNYEPEEEIPPPQMYGSYYWVAKLCMLLFSNLFLCTMSSIMNNGNFIIKLYFKKFSFLSV